MIDYDKLQELVGVGSYDQLRSSHKQWVEEYLGRGEKARQEEWTDSIAVGGRPFVQKVKAILGVGAKGRDIIQATEGYQVREGLATYKALSSAKKEDIGLQNTYPGTFMLNNQVYSVARPPRSARPI